MRRRSVGSSLVSHNGLTSAISQVGEVAEAEAEEELTAPEPMQCKCPQLLQMRTVRPQVFHR